MYTIRVSTRFRRDMKRSKKQGKDVALFKNVNALLSSGQAFPEKFRDHLLTGNWHGHRECHLTPDWLLIYRVNEQAKEIEYVRIGSHSELFR